MKRERTLTCIYGACLSFLLSFGAVGAMSTGLELPVTGIWFLAAVCVSTSILCAAACRFGAGLPMLAVLLIGSAVALWRVDAAAEQTLAMLYRITSYYRNAYGWKVIGGASLLGKDTVMDYPLGIIALWVAVCNCWNLCRNRGDRDGLILAVLPVAACLVVNDTVPKPIFLYLWMLGIVLVLLSSESRRKSAAQGNRMIGMAVVPAVLALGLLFWAVPQEGYDKRPEQLQESIVNWLRELPDLWEEASDELASAVDGAVQTTRVNLDTLGPRLKRVYPVMEVKAPVSGSIYLRGQDYDIYTGSGWEASKNRTEQFPPEEAARELGTITIRTRRVRDVLYLPYYPEEPWILEHGRVENERNEQAYSFTLCALQENWRSRVMADMDSVSIRQTLTTVQSSSAWLALPEDTRTGAVEILKSILTDENTATAAADTIARYVRSSALYDLDTQRMPEDGGDFALWFLEQGETGYCVHFATAATVLLRAAGIEARYVEGYLADAQADRDVTVTADQAHAWAEYFEPRLGTWIVLEATPADLTEEETTVPGTRETTGPTEQTETEPVSDIPDTPKENSPTAATEGDAEKPGTKQDLSWLGSCLLWLAIPGVTAFAVAGQRKLRLERRSRRCRRGKPNARALARWRELARLHRLLKTEPSPEAEQIAEKAKYSQHSASREELALLNDQILAAKDQLQERPWYIKWIDQYIFAVY